MRLWDGDHRGRGNRLMWPGYCGSSIPEPFVSPGNEMWIRFASRDQVVASGFEIMIEEGNIYNTYTIYLPIPELFYFLL